MFGEALCTQGLTPQGEGEGVYESIGAFSEYSFFI